MRGIRTSVFIMLVGAMSLFGFVPSAYAIPIGWVCIGTCGTLGADGVVTAPPSGPNYDYVSTDNGVAIADLNLGSETNGTTLTSVAFAANAGDPLAFYFNFVTSDGAGFADYAWAELLDANTMTTSALLFTARTTPGGNTAPGFGMPANSATLTPATTPIIPGGPVWSALGGGESSGGCFSTGCGYTGWIQSTYAIPNAGTYVLKFGTVNWSDTAYDTGLAFAGTTVAGVPIEPGTPSAVPEPATMLLFGSGLLAVARKVRSRRKTE